MQSENREIAETPVCRGDQVKFRLGEGRRMSEKLRPSKQKTVTLRRDRVTVRRRERLNRCGLFAALTEAVRAILPLLPE